MRRFITIITLCLCSFIYSQVDYETQIQPIFDANCVSCHSNGAAYTGGIELTSFDELMAGGYTTNSTNVLSVLDEYVSMVETNTAKLNLVRTVFSAEKKE